MKAYNGYKKCCHCDIIYPIVMFHKDKSTTDGLDCKCKDCRKEYDLKQKKIYYENNRDYIIQYKRKFYSENKYRIAEEYHHKPEVKKKKSEYYKKYSKTKSGRESIKRRNNKRNRKLGFNKIIENPFSKEVKINWHHINDNDVVPIPMDLHKLYHNPDKEIHRELLKNIVEQILNLKEVRRNEEIYE